MGAKANVYLVDRRSFIIGAAAVAAGASAMPIQPSCAQFERIRSRLGLGARLGVGIFDASTHRALGYDLNSRYPLASTFKVPLVAAILSEIDNGRRSLSDQVVFSSADVVEYAPVLRRHLARGRTSLRELCAAALQQSDNTAANLLLRELGGPGAFNAFVRRCGDSVTRLDRYEPHLNINTPGDEQDTTTPAAMSVLAHSLYFGDVLSYQSQGALLRWNRNMISGHRRAAADRPPQPALAQNRGSIASGEVWPFDWPEEHERLTVATYISGGDSTPMGREAAHAAVARLINSSLNIPPRYPEPFP